MKAQSSSGTVHREKRSSCASSRADPCRWSSTHRGRCVRTELRRRLGPAGHLPGRAAAAVRDRLRGRRAGSTSSVPGVNGFAPGQRVDRAHAVRRLRDPGGDGCPRGRADPRRTWTSDVAAALPTQGCTAYFCAEEMVRLHPGDRVLVQAAAGGVGTLLVQLCKRRGCIVYGTAGSDEKIEYLRSLGVDHPIKYRREDFATAVRAAPRRCRGST